MFSPLCIGAMNLYLDGDKPLIGGNPALKKEIEAHLVREEFDYFIIELDQDENLSNIDFKTLKNIFNFRIYQLFGVELTKSSYSKTPISKTGLDIPIPLDELKHLSPPSYTKPDKNYFLIEYFIPANLNAKLYIDEINVKTSKSNYSIPIKIKIYDFNIPKATTIKTSFGFSPWSVTKKHYGKWDEKELELHKLYFDEALKHRIDLHKVYPKYPELNDLTAKDLLNIDVQEKYAFLKIWEDYRKGFSSEFGFKWGTTDLPIPPKYKNTEEDSLKFWRALEKSVVLNNLVDDVFVYYDDEPKFDEIPKIKSALTIIKKEAPKLHFLLTKHYQKSLDSLIDWWCPNFSEWNKPNFPDPKFYQERQLKGEKVWTYVSCMAHGCDADLKKDEPDFVIDREASYLRILPWIAAKENFNGILYYDTVYGYEFEGESPWKDSYAFSGYGEGNLFYPCNQKICNSKNQLVIPSLRLKIFRDGLEDSEILLYAKSKGINLDFIWSQIRKIPNSNSTLVNLKKTLLQKLFNEKKK